MGEFVFFAADVAEGEEVAGFGCAEVFDFLFMDFAGELRFHNFVF